MRLWHSSEIDLAAITAGAESSLVGHLGIEFVEIGDDALTARMPVDRRTIQPFGRLHGGASLALAETVASFAGMLTLDTERWVVVGLEINANHIRPVTQGFVYGTARSEALGRSTQVWGVRITDADRRLVCLSRVTLAVIPVDRA